MRYTKALRILAAAVLLVAGAARGDETYRLDIPAQPLSKALQTFAEQSGIQVVYYAQIAEGQTASRVRGTLSANEALTRLLAGTNLRFETVNADTVAIRPISPTGGGGGKSGLHDGAGVSENKVDPRGALRLADSAAANAAAGQQNTANGQNASADADRQDISEVIVTATKRAERLQDVPISIAVIGNQDIERRGLIGMEDYLRSIPGANEVNNGNLSNVIVIRGITTSPEFESLRGGGITVATYFDETPITGAGGIQGGIDVRPVDLERIEVLRGPQGTTFGDASIGGALRLLPAKPKLDGWHARVAGSFSNTSGAGSDNSMVQGMVNVPLVTDRLAVRAVGYRYDDSGFYRNIVGDDPAAVAAAVARGFGSLVQGYTRDDVGRMVTVGGRLAALWQPTENLNLSATYLTQKIEQDGFAYASAGAFTQSRYPVDPRGRVRGEPGNVADTNVDLVNAALNYDMGWGTLTTVASWIDSDAVYADSSSLNGVGLSQTTRSGISRFVAEARIASHLPGRLQFLGGLYYEDTDNEYGAIYWWPGTPGAFPVNPPATAPTGNLLNPSHTEQRAVFGELSYALTDQITAAVGGRLFDYKKTASEYRDGNVFAAPLGGGTLTRARGDGDDSIFKASLNYKPTPDALLYASWSQGFRLGPPDNAGVNRTLCDTDNDGLLDNTDTTIESTRHVDSDSLDNYELGTKLALFGRRMTLDTAVYHIKWDNMPFSVLPPPGAICRYNANAGAATSDGIELQASVIVANGLKVDFGGGYTRAKLSKDAAGLTPPAFEGDRLPGSPKMSANFGVQYDFNVAGYKTFVRADSFYTGSFYGELLELPGTRAGDYIKVDARAGVAVRQLSVELFVRNLTNDDAFTWRGISGALSGTGNPFYGYRLQPRTVGLQLGYSFE